MGDCMDNVTDKLNPVKENGNASHLQSIEQRLNEIDRTLHQMLLLAELSAGDGRVNRQSLQATLDRLRDRIDRIADQMESH